MSLFRAMSAARVVSAAARRPVLAARPLLAAAPRRFLATEAPRPAVFGPAGKLATKLFEEGEASKNLPAIRTDLVKFKEFYDRDSDVRALFLNPVLSVEEKDAQLDTLFQQQGVQTEEAKNFIKGAAATKSMGRIKQIVTDFDKLVTWALKEVHAVVTTAEPLTDAQRTRLEAALKKKVGADQQLLLKTEVDPTILGGMVVMMDQTVLDVSVQAQVQNMDAALRA